MKTNMFFVLLCWWLLVGCAKSFADEQGFFDPNYHLRNAGTSAKELLTDSVFRSLKIEVQYMKGAEPDSAALENLKKFLTKHLHKPGGISITTSEIPTPQDTVFSLQEIMRIEDANRKHFTKEDEIAVYILYANGYYFNNHLLGYAYRNTSAVLFGSQIRMNSNQIRKPGRTYLESRVLQHEFGHLLGLVNVISASQHSHHDAENGQHCTNRYCLMYYLTDTNDYPVVLTKGTPAALDKHCLADLRANGGK